LFALAAFLWLPAAAHCQLESIPGLEFLSCQAGTSYSENPASHCSDTGCCSVEESQYKTEQLRLTLSLPDLLPISFVPIVAAANPLPNEVSLGILTAAPPQLLKTWNFATRTALPARAPSLAS
jgi:hypothetical protein